MYYELIKMLIAYEKKMGHSDQKHLTSRLQSYLNQRFLEDVECLKKKTSVCDIRRISQEVNQDDSLEMRMKTLELNQEKLQKSNKELKDANFLMMSRFTEMVKMSKNDPSQVRNLTIYIFNI